METGNLILERKLGQTLRIGDDITVTFATQKRNGVIKLAIRAPKGVSIHREEVWERVQRGEA